MRFLSSIVILVIAFTGISVAQNYKLKSYVVGSSATVSSNANYTFNSTIGQPAIGTATGTNQNAYLGFWYQDAPNPLEMLLISLSTGWNMVSSNVEAQETLMDSIFKDINNNVLIVKNGSGKIYVPSFDINTIGSWDITQGYQVYATTNVDLEIEGNRVKPENTPIYPATGWNLLAYLRTNPMDASQALNSLVDRSNLLIAKNGTGKIYVPQFNINTIGDMVETQGYQLYVVGLDTLLYPANGIPKQNIIETTPIAQKLIPEFEKTGKDMTVIVNGDFEDGTEIGVYDNSQKLIGSGVFNENYAGITVWGDDEYTDIKDGATEDEKLYIKVLNNESLFDKELIFAENNTELRYKNNDVVIGKINSEFEQASINVSPAPVVDHLALDITNMNGSKNIEIRDLEGEIVFSTRINGDDLMIDMSKYSNSTYFITVSNENTRKTEKVVKVK